MLAIGYFGFCVWNSALLEPLPIQQDYILALTACTVGMIAFASGRLTFALVFGGTLFFGLKFLSVVKFQYLQSPLMPADFVYFVRASLLETLKHYPHLYAVLAAVCVAVPVVLYGIWRFDFRFPPHRRWLHAGWRAAGAASSALAVLWCLQPAGPFAAVYPADPWHALENNAQLTGFFVAIHDMQPVLPAMSDDATAQQDWASTTKDPAPTVNAASTDPDIIQVLEESTFDPTELAACTIPQCRAKMFQPDQYTRAHGPLRTHTFGGQTWVSEFAVFSGMPQDIFGPAGMYAPFILAPRLRDSLPQLLRRIGYLTIAVYPTGGDFLNARNAYAAYGFDKFYDSAALGLQTWHTTDERMFAEAKRIYDENKKPGQPIFMMILTLEQHGPHDIKPLKDLPEPFDRGLLPDLPADLELNLSTYLSRLRDSDQAMTQLERDFLHRAQPTVIVHFGDHLPSFGGLIRGMPRTLPPALEPYRNDLTYFMLKSNFEEPPLPAYPMLDIAYLPVMVLRAAGLPEDPYFAALSELESRCQGLYDECRNAAQLKSYYGWIFNHLHIMN
ncbi:MAG TPA: sulfatase-like hydrolase/transferase [Burkholderiales bacterium]|nr:sulfatase-like hydrolase/transferase [Burkholderiales bacterium]